MAEPKIIITKRNFIRIASLEDEWDLDVVNPEKIMNDLKSTKNIRADIFTFWQRIPHIAPTFDYHKDWDNVAVLDYVSYHHWFHKILDSKTRNMIRKAEKMGVSTKVVPLDEQFVRGIVDIYNEAPNRQGKRFWHYGKTFEEVKNSNATHLERSDFIGAYFNDEMIGFIKLVYGDRTARTEQIISKFGHRDKAPTNALVSRAVDLCEKKGIPYIVYGRWPEGSLAQFKKNNGFKRYDVPRYFIPLNLFGTIAIKCNLYKDIKYILPKAIRKKVIEYRDIFYSN